MILTTALLLQALSVRCSATATELPASLQTLVQAFQSVQDPMAVSRPATAAQVAARCASLLCTSLEAALL
jgi:hypothetical protein